MKKFPPSYFFITFGVLLALFFLLADFIGLGKAGIQAAQIFGMEIGAVFVLVGFIFRTLENRNTFQFESFWANLKNSVRDFSALTWVILGMLPAFILYVIVPMFFDSTHRIQYPVGYIRQIVPIGIDFQSMLGAIDLWVHGGQSTQYVFTPFINIFFAPLLLLQYPNSYYVITFITLASYLGLSLLAILMSDVKNRSAVAVIAVVSIFSYGLMFELERGQTYTLSLTFCILAVYLFHWQRDLRWLAYIFFCISIQLKFYPALFVVLFVDDWRDWKNIIFRFFALGLTSILLFFLFGFSYFSLFYAHMTGSMQSGEPSLVNHSIQSFVFMLSSSEWNLFTGSTMLWMQNNSSMISNLLYIYFLLCFLTVLISAWVRNKPGFNADLLLVCVVGSLVLPSVNHDYTLSLLTAPFAVSIAAWNVRDFSRSKILAVVLTLIASFAYAVILIPHVFKPLYLKNSLPMLFVLLTVAALQSLFQKSAPKQN